MALTAAVWLSPVAELEHSFGLRLLYAMRGVVAAPPDIVIVAIDSASAQRLALSDSPERWPRSIHARLIDGLAASGAEVIGFDILFNQARDVADDLALAEALRRAGNVYLAEAIWRDTHRAPDGRVLATTDRRILPLPLIAEAARGTAPFVMPKTPDGVFEFWTVIPAVGDRPSLPMAMAEHLGSRDGPQAGESAEIPRAASSSAISSSRRSLNLYGPLGTVQTVSYAHALELVADREAGAAAFGGKAVLVGYSESNQSKQADVYRTPYSTADGVDISGVELCATALGNLQQASWLRRPGESLTLALLSLYAGLLVLPWALARPAAAALFTCGLALGYAGLAHLAFARCFVWLPLVVPLAFAPVIAAALGIVARYREVQRRRVELEHAVELGIPRQALEKLKTLLGDTLGGRTVFAVCLCSDIEAFTTLSESLTPAQTHAVLNRYLARFLPVIERHGGYASDLVGDSVMSLWVTDTASDSASRSACQAALELDLAMNADDGEGALRSRFGLHCGPIYFGEVGGGGRHEIRAVGDIVNTASRIQGANKYLGTRVLASAAVAEALDPGQKRFLGRFAMVGKRRVLELVQLTRAGPSESATHRFALGLAAFGGGDFAAAAGHFAAAQAAGDTGPSAFYLEQCRHLANAPVAPDWCGIVTLHAK